MASAFDGAGQDSLVFGAITRNAARHHLALFGQKPLQAFGIFKI